VVIRIVWWQGICILLGKYRTELGILGWDLGLISICLFIINFRHSREVSEFFDINQVMLAMFLLYHVTERASIDEGDVEQSHCASDS